MAARAYARPRRFAESKRPVATQMLAATVLSIVHMSIWVDADARPKVINK
jgi:hypothetical protein